MRWQRGFAHGVVVALALCAAFLQARGLTQLVYAALLASFPPAPPDELLLTAQAPPAPAAPAAGALAPRLATPPAEPTTPAPAPAPASSEPSPSPRQLISGLRVVPETVDGRVLGVRLLGVRQGSLLSLLGLHDGDRLQAINGYELTSPGNALRAYAALRHESDFDLELSRQGQTVRLTYRVR